MINERLGLIAAILLCWSTANAQHSNYNFSRVDIENGLSHNQVYAIYRDSTGFVWFGTASGLNRFDGYTCRVFTGIPNDTTSLPDNNIAAIFGLPGNKMWLASLDSVAVYDPVTEKFDRHYQYYLANLQLPQSRLVYSIKDKQGNYWFVFEKEGLYKYSVKEGRSTRFISTEKQTAGKAIDQIAEDLHGNIWLVYANGFLLQLNAGTLQPMHSADLLPAVVKTGKLKLRLFADRHDNLWVYSGEEPLGLFKADLKTNTVTRISKTSSPLRLNDNMITGVIQDEQGIIWVGTDHGGINLIKESADAIAGLLVNQENNKGSLGYNSIERLYQDDRGLIWVGTGKKGVSYLNQHIVQFDAYRHEPNNKNSLPYNDINFFQEDRKGNVWIGTNGGGLVYFDRHKQQFTQYLNNPADAGSLCSNIIVCLCLDHRDRLWIGTYLGGLDVFDGKTFRHFRHDPADSNSVGDNNIWDIREDKSNTMWIGTLRAGLDRYDEESKKFVHYMTSSTSMAVHSNYVPIICEDREDNLWVGGSQGLDVLNKDRSAFTYYNHTDDPASLSYQNITDVIQDKSGRIWVATRMGLNVFNSRTRQFKRFTTNEGLPDNVILSLTEDKGGNLWITTPTGCSRLSIKTAKDDIMLEVRNFTETNNLQGKVFNESAAMVSSDGLFFAGGSTGFNVIDPQKVVSSRTGAPLAFTSIDIFNNELNAGQEINKKVVLRKAVPFTTEIALSNNENIFSIEFTALDFSHNNKYAYKLEGFNKNWMYASGNNRKVTYTNLDPGTYTFKVKATNSDGVWTAEEKTLTVIIKPPFWKTPMAFILYLLVIAAMLYLSRRYTLEKARMRFEVALQTKERERIQALDAVKTKFFTNVSHEFRTPLSLILTPLDRIIHNHPDPEQKKQLQLVQRNAKRLLSLVNQLLDFRKMEVQAFTLQPTQGDIIKFTREITSSFSDMSEMKSIGLSFSTDTDSCTVFFDKDKVEKILFNLLSNAFKYTPAGGHIEVSTEHIELAGTPEDQIIITVHDTGIGIPAAKQEMIFERFFQHDVAANLTNPGTGIGLAITKEFVKLHNGTIVVKSEPDKGTYFIVTLPVQKPGIATTPATITSELITRPGAEPVPDNKYSRPGKKDRPVILLAEDNDDFRFYLKDNLKHVYDVVESCNGQEAWEKLEKIQPDLIISDLMMPCMDGIELAKRVRRNPSLGAIPFILLTALGDEAMQLESYRLGVSDYITKPFTYEILASRIKNLLAQAKQTDKKSPRFMDVMPSEIDIPPADEQFIKQVLQVIEKNISNPAFTVEELSRELFMHRVGMYRKLLSITGISPLEFIRSIRLKRGKQLLEKSQLTIAEVAYEVGFNNPKKFSQHFKETFGVTPSQFQKQHAKGI